MEVQTFLSPALLLGCLHHQLLYNFTHGISSIITLKVRVTGSVILSLMPFLKLCVCCLFGDFVLGVAAEQCSDLSERFTNCRFPCEVQFQMSLCILDV